MDFFLYCAAIWFFFYLINHSLIFQKLRLAAMPALPDWLRGMLECSFCCSFWFTCAICIFFTGFSLWIFSAPPCCLMFDLVFRRLNK